MSMIQAGADALEALVERDRALINLAAGLKALGSVEQAITERNSALAEVAQSHEAAKALLAQTRQELVDAQSAHAKEATEHGAAMAAKCDAATAAAAVILKSARTDAEHLVQAAKDEVVRVQKGHAEEMAKTGPVLKELHRQIAAEQATLAALHGEQARVAGAIEAMKQSVQSVFGKK